MRRTEALPNIPDDIKDMHMGKNKPEPPKYIVNADGTMTRVSVASGQCKLSYVPDTKRPTAQRISDQLPMKTYTQTPHHYVSESKTFNKIKGGIVDSKTQFKGEYTEEPPISHIGNSFHHYPNTPSFSKYFYLLIVIHIY